jgi:hypothetical protein
MSVMAMLRQLTKKSGPVSTVLYPLTVTLDA